MTMPSFEEPRAARLRPYLESNAIDHRPPVPAQDRPGDDPGWLRPYQLTGGRTAPVDPTLAMEAQVVAEPHAGSGGLAMEYRDLVSAARTPVSLAELGAYLRLHLQVVRVLVADLAAEGHLRVLRPTVNAATDPELIERVIRGLSRIA